ncbi:MAG: hypothetical protein HY716_11970 [Planctomycetes bacterium]|nr:hypothetical protein [Planctomycetota bacterium]
MKTMLWLGMAAAVAAGDRIDEIKWMSSEEAFEKAQDEKTSRWVLIYKEWPR